MYITSAEPMKPSKLARVITHVGCSLAAEDDQRHAEPPLINRTASFLAAGSAIYRSATTPRAADWRRTGTASYRSASPRPPCTITPRPRPAHPIERPTDTHGHEPPESLSNDRQLRRSLPHPNRNAHLAKLIFPAGVSSVAGSLLPGPDAANKTQFTLRICRKITRSFLKCGMLMWYGRQGGSGAGAGGQVPRDLAASG